MPIIFDKIKTQREIMDRLIRGISENKQVRYFAVDATNVVKKATGIHRLSVTNSVLMGRILIATLLMSADLKSEKNLITLKLDGDGPNGKIVVTGRKNGYVKSYMSNPANEIPLNLETKAIDVKDAIGDGTLTVIKDLGLKNPYVGQVELKYKTVAEDLTYYFVKSEQIPSSVGLGVLIGTDGSVKKAGGFLIQLLPNTDEKVIAKIEENLAKFPNFTDMLDIGYTIDELVENFILKGLNPQLKCSNEVDYNCDCSKKKFLNGIKLLPKNELKKAIEDNEILKIQCHFCNVEYEYNKNDVQKILSEMKHEV